MRDGEGWSEVGDRVYVRRHRSMDLNVGLVVGEGACLVVDTRATEEQGRELAASVRTVTPHPWSVVNTHMHFDHTFGNAVFRPAPVWGHRRCAEALAGAAGERMRERIAGLYRQAGEDAEAERIAAARLDPPDRLVEDAAILDVGGRTVRLVHLGRGHTDNDLVVLVPDAGLLLAGDLVEEGAPPQWRRLPAGLAGHPGRAARARRRAGAARSRRRRRPGVRARPAGRAGRAGRAGDAARAGHAQGRPAADVAGELPYFGEHGPRAVERAYAQLDATPT